MEGQKGNVYACKTKGTPANIDENEGQRHHRAPGVGSHFNHSSSGRETMLNLTFNWANLLSANFARFLLWDFLFRRGWLFIPMKNTLCLNHVVSCELLALVHSFVMNKYSKQTPVLNSMYSQEDQSVDLFFSTSTSLIRLCEIEPLNLG